MCGIVGVKGNVDRSVLDEMLSCITHRGPDGEGRFVAPDSGLMMGARRLAIVDIEGGSQPVYNETGDVAVVFNGEIYNYAELRSELEADGHRFTTRCDTEVLVHLWEEYGERAPEYLNGMFAFSLWDGSEETLFLARDRLGIKPLFFSAMDDRIVWGSEVAAVLAAGVPRTIDQNAVYEFFSLNYTPWPRTLFENVRKVPPGTSLTVTEDGVSQRSFWELSDTPVSGSRDSVATRIREELNDSVERRRMADVPIGAFLSGGIDSSSIVGLLSEQGVSDLDTFSIGFQSDQFDESEEARFVAEHFGTNHHEIVVDLSSMDAFSTVVEHYGEPLADPAVLPTLMLSEHARDHVKVALSGEGADELFAGYQHARTLSSHRSRFGTLPETVYKLADGGSEIVPIGGKHLRYFASLQRDETSFLEWARGFNPPPEEYLAVDVDAESSGLLDTVESAFEATEGGLAKRISAFDLRHYLADDLLYKVDHASMAASLEARVPFLDHSFVEFAYNIPPEYKGRGDDYKPLLKRAMSDILPRRVLNRQKHGLSVPVGRWFEGEHEAIEGWLTEENVAATPYLDTETVFEIWSDHRSGTRNNGMTLWKTLNYVAWYHTKAKR